MKYIVIFIYMHKRKCEDLSFFLMSSLYTLKKLLTLFRFGLMSSSAYLTIEFLPNLILSSFVFLDSGSVSFIIELSIPSKESTLTWASYKWLARLVFFVLYPAFWA